jgi:hypothetical protein
MNCSIKKYRTSKKLTKTLLISLLVVQAIIANMQINREVPLGFRFLTQVGTISGERFWCVFTKDKNSYRMYHPLSDARATFVRSPIPKFKLHDTQDPPELDYVKEDTTRFYLAGSDVLAVYDWGFNMAGLPKRVFSQKMGPNLRVPGTNTIREIFLLGANKAYIWIGLELWAYNPVLKTLVSADIIDNSVVVDLFMFQSNVTYNLWFKSSTEFFLRSNLESNQSVINSINLQTSSLVNFPIQKIIGFKAFANTWITLVSQNSNSMTLLVGEIGPAPTHWGPTGGVVRFAYQMIKDPNVDFYEMGTLWTSGKRWFIFHDGDRRMRLIKIHNSSW